MKSVTNNSYTHFLTSLALHLLIAALVIFGLQPKNLKLADSTVDFVLTPFQQNSVKTNTAMNPVRNTSKPEMAAVPESKNVESLPEAEPSVARPFQPSQTGTVATTAEQSYIAHVRWLLEKNKKFPVLAKKQGHFGTVQIQFTVAADGVIQHSKIAQSTDYDSLNQAALQILKSIQKFDPFPAEIQKTEWTFILPIEFKLQ